MFENVINFFKNVGKSDKERENGKSKNAAKERLHLVLMQDRANVSADFLDLMKQEIIEVIKKYICVDENAIDVRLTNKSNGDGTNGAPALYANIPIVSIKQEVKNGMARQKQEEIEEQEDFLEEDEEPKEKKTIKSAKVTKETKKVTAKAGKAKENEAKIEAKTTKNSTSKKTVEKASIKSKTTATVGTAKTKEDEK